MVNIPSISELTLENIEYCYLVGAQHCNSASFKVKIPRIMSSVFGSGNSTVKKEIFNKNIFSNSSNTRPSSGGSINIQNYITIPRSPQCNLIDVANPITLIIPSGQRLRFTCINGDYKKAIITDYR